VPPDDYVIDYLQAAGLAAPKLTRLELHGFKSFAARTVFAFEPGITAVVGPNGSGKSNVADAVRWVLGETSHHALRSKRTDDVIFAGGAGRAPAGLAEVTVTFANETRWLPSEFTEVTVTRRAYRGGDNQYLINGRRVRLKDVALLTASLGQSYTVVGQGLVDAALSQRAEDRRGLFEHAADLTGLRLKAQDAERNLAEVERNTERLSDLLAELEPRLRTLERAARQAREWQGLRDRLTTLQQTHYRRLLTAAQTRRAAADEALTTDTAALARARAALSDLAAERAAASTAAEDARDRLARHDARLATLTEQARRLGHERDLVRERLSALVRRRQDMADTQSGLDEQVAKATHDGATIAATVQRLDAAVTAARAEVARHEAQAAAGRDERLALERATADLSRTLTAHERTAADHAQRRALLTQRRETAEAERDRAATEAAERAARAADLARELDAFAAEDRRLAADQDGHDARLSHLASSLEEASGALRDAGARLADAERAHGQSSNRLDVLQRLQASGDGLHGGVRRVMRWRHEGKLAGIRGTLAELIAVDARYETAIEVALGGRLQDVVVDRWADAEAAIGSLKRANAGRATFQLLDTVGAASRHTGNRAAPAAAQPGPGRHGIAADLVRAEPDVAGVVRALLGRTVVVDDLPAARRLLPELPSGWGAVTLAGEIARVGGSVTGGSAVRESGVLGRERELRDLPAEVARLADRCAAKRDERHAAAKHADDIAAERGRVASERAALQAMRAERRGQHARLDGWHRELQSQHVAAERRVAAAAEAVSALARDLETLEADAGRTANAVATACADHQAALSALTDRQEAATADDAALGAAHREVTVLDERLRAERRHEASIAAHCAALAEELGHRAERLSTLDGERTALAAQTERLDREVASLDQAVTTARTERTPLASAGDTSQRQAVDLARRGERSQAALLDHERALGQRQLAAERAAAELATIHARIADDLDLDSPQTLLDTVPVDPDEVRRDVDLEREIGRLKERLRRVGYVGEDVVAEYDREAEHQGFLRSQLDDVLSAAASLRRLLADLRDTMRTRFETVFTEVSKAFGESFTTLFGGGTARLVLSDDDEGDAASIDIVAQPPGKRLQGLALLSGGERALTGVALLFAILKVNPTPFVLLDEVDAALDEANVVRFRDELRHLARETQAVVITHNRGTVEIADTLYGVTMGADGVSQVLSLRLADVPPDEDVVLTTTPAVSISAEPFS